MKDEDDTSSTRSSPTMMRELFTQPIPMPQAVAKVRDDLRHRRLWQVLALWPTGVVCGVVSGALMNAINGFVSPYALHPYFEQQFAFLPPHWSRWETIVQHGMWEGFWFGVGFSFLFTFYVAVVSRLSCPSQIGVRALLRTVGLLWAVWFLCGLNAFLLRKFAPNWLDSVTEFGFYTLGLHMLGSYIEPTENFAAASVLGIYYFGIFAIIAGCLWFSADWRKYKVQRVMNI